MYTYNKQTTQKILDEKSLTFFTLKRYEISGEEMVRIRVCFKFNMRNTLTSGLTTCQVSIVKPSARQTLKTSFESENLSPSQLVGRLNFMSTMNKVNIISSKKNNLLGTANMSLLDFIDNNVSAKDVVLKPSSVTFGFTRQVRNILKSKLSKSGLTATLAIRNQRSKMLVKTSIDEPSANGFKLNQLSFLRNGIDPATCFFPVSGLFYDLDESITNDPEYSNFLNQSSQTIKMSNGMTGVFENIQYKDLSQTFSNTPITEVSYVSDNRISDNSIVSIIEEGSSSVNWAFGEIDISRKLLKNSFTIKVDVKDPSSGITVQSISLPASLALLEGSNNIPTKPIYLAAERNPVNGLCSITVSTSDPAVASIRLYARNLYPSTPLEYCPWILVSEIDNTKTISTSSKTGRNSRKKVKNNKASISSTEAETMSDIQSSLNIPIEGDQIAILRATPVNINGEEFGNFSSAILQAPRACYTPAYGSILLTNVSVRRPEGGFIRGIKITVSGISPLAKPRIVRKNLSIGEQYFTGNGFGSKDDSRSLGFDIKEIDRNTHRTIYGKQSSPRKITYSELNSGVIKGDEYIDRDVTEYCVYEYGLALRPGGGPETIVARSIIECIEPCEDVEFVIGKPKVQFPGQYIPDTDPDSSGMSPTRRSTANPVTSDFPTPSSSRRAFVSIDLNTNVKNTQVEEVIESLSSAGLLDRFENDINVFRNQIKSMTRFGVTRIDSLTGESFYLGTYRPGTFVDDGSAGSARPTSEREYMYKISLLVMSPEEALDSLKSNTFSSLDSVSDLCNSIAISKLRQKFFNLDTNPQSGEKSPLEKINKKSLKTATISTDKRGQSSNKSVFESHYTGADRYVKVSISSASKSSLNSRKRLRVTKDRLSGYVTLQWSYSRGPTVDYFVITSSRLGDTVVCGTSHAGASDSNFAFVDKMHKKFSGSIKYTIHAVLLSGVIENVVTKSTVFSPSVEGLFGDGLTESGYTTIADSFIDQHPLDM